MTKATEALASAELERHEPKMLYAERQLWKAGEHERLAQSLVRRTRIHLVVGSVAAALLIASGSRLYILWAAVIVGSLVLELSHARRTLQTIQRLNGMDEPAPPG